MLIPPPFLGGRLLCVGLTLLHRRRTEDEQHEDSSDADNGKEQKRCPEPCPATATPSALHLTRHRLCPF
jgi:hypothetical protein